MRRVLPALLATILLPGCFSNDADLTPQGEGKPVVAVDIPEQTEAGGRVVATVEIQNPGPGDIDDLVVSFSVLGAPDLPNALVGFGSNGQNPSIISIDPEPEGVSPDGVVYRFGPLEEGDSTSVEFTLRTPAEPGTYANSVTVSDGGDVERSKGVPMETLVER
jgi:hypothetical protein